MQHVFNFYEFHLKIKLKRMSNKLSICLFISIMLTVYAQYSYGQVDEHIEELLVLGESRRGNDITIASSTVLGRHAIESSGESSLLSAVSVRVPSMFVSQRGVTGFGVAAGAAGGISMRGIGGSPTTGVLVLIDGHPQYMGIMGHHLPDAYQTYSVQMVEVLRGPASALYGSNAMGGAINIITRKQERDGYNIETRAMYGSHNTQKYATSISAKRKRLDTQLNMGYDKTDGHRPNSKFDMLNSHFKFGYQAFNRIKFISDFNLAAYRSENPGTVSQPIVDNKADILRGVASLTAENKFYDGSGGAVKLFYNFGNHKINDGYTATSSPRDYLFNSNDYNYGLTAYHTHKLFQTDITTGVDFKNFGGHARDVFFDNKDDKELVKKSANEFAAYVFLRHRFNNLDINAGLRLENSSIFGFEWVPQFGFAYNIFWIATVKGVISKGFRSPTIRELYYARDTQLGAASNPDLKPERVMNYELSLANNNLFQQKLKIELTTYIIDGKNIISVQRDDNEGRNKNMNIGKFTNKGIELDIKYRLLKQISINANYSYLAASKPVLNAPKRLAYFETTYNLNKFMFVVNYQYVNNLHVRLDTPLVESYGLLGTKILYRPLNFLEVFIKGENLTNEKYQIIMGFPMQGITAFVGMNLKMRK
jgi:iron complex outermembrane receptor protein